MKVLVMEAVLPKYEIPLLEKLSTLPGIELVVLADLHADHQLNQYNSQRDKFVAKHVDSRSLGGVVFRPGLIRKLREIKPDIVILNGNPRDISQAIALLWCKLNRIPVGLWSMFHRFGHQRLVSEIYYRYAGALGDLLMSYAERGRSEQLGRGTPPEKIMVLTTAIDGETIMQVRDSVTDQEVERFRVASGLVGKRVLLHVARLEKVKRPDLTVKCFERLLRLRTDVELVWIGGGPLENETENLAASLGVIDRMRFLGPIYDEQQLALWYKSSEVFVIAAGIGLSIHHAMCYGLPVVTDNNVVTQGSEFEVLKNEINGLTYQSGDLDDFAKKVNRILDDDGCRRFLSANARDTIEKEFTLARKVENFAIAFDLLGRKAQLDEGQRS